MYPQCSRCERSRRRSPLLTAVHRTVHTHFTSLYQYRYWYLIPYEYQHAFSALTLSVGRQEGHPAHPGGPGKGYSVKALPVSSNIKTASKFQRHLGEVVLSNFAV